MTTEKRCPHCGQKVTEMDMPVLDGNGQPIGPGVAITVAVVGELFGICGTEDNGYRVRHLPTSRLIARGVNTAAEARVICEALALRPEPWRFTTMDEFVARLPQMKALRDAALREAGIDP